MSEITKIHNDVFSILFSWSEQQRQNNIINPYFYLRTVRDKRFKSGYWFPGNDDYLCISFWHGGDAYNKTPNAYFEINIKKGCRAILTSKDSEEKFTFLSNIANVSNLTLKDRHYIKKGKVWEKIYSRNYEAYSDALAEFIQIDKGFIDSFIEENEDDLVLEEFVQPFTFIRNVDFEEMLNRVKNEKREIEKNKTEQRKIELQKPHLPFALKSISIENFQGINTTSLKNFPLDAKWIFVTGENGYGKTLFLQSIALAFNFNLDLEKYINEKTRIHCEGIIMDEEFSVTRIKGNTVNLKSIPFSNFIIGYGPSRLNVQAETSQNEEDNSNNNILGIFSNSTLLKNITYELFATDRLNIKAFNELKELVREVTNGRINDIRVEGREVLFREIANGSEEMGWLPLHSLATGFRNIINIVGDIYIRFSRSQKHSNYKKFFGIVLIDELENHLHPILQKELPSKLSKVFPNIQFIATTHSPIPLLGIPDKAIIITVKRSKKQGVEVQRLIKMENQIKELLPDTILTSSIFNFDYLETLSESEFKKIPLEDNYKDIEKYRELNDRLKNLSKDIFPDQLFNEE